MRERGETLGVSAQHVRALCTVHTAGGREYAQTRSEAPTIGDRTKHCRPAAQERAWCRVLSFACEHGRADAGRRQGHPSAGILARSRGICCPRTLQAHWRDTERHRALCVVHASRDREQGSAPAPPPVQPSGHSKPDDGESPSPRGRERGAEVCSCTSVECGQHRTCTGACGCAHAFGRSPGWPLPAAAKGGRPSPLDRGITP